MKITGRSSSITNAFVNSIIPIIEPTNEQVSEALEILNMGNGNIHCSYCGDKYTEWDHLRPIVLNKKPTGFISEIHNLVPACGKCNQSKGNKPWEAWVLSSAKLSPKSRGIHDLADRIERLKNYENWQKPTKVDFEDIVGISKWSTHWENCEKVQKMMRESQLLATEINIDIKRAFA
jgi:endonuclease I